MCFGSVNNGWRHTTIEVVYKHLSVETMMWTSTNGLHESLPALVESIIVKGSKCVDLSLQIIGLVGTEEFL